MNTDFVGILEKLQENIPTKAIYSDTLKDIAIHVWNSNYDVDHQRAEYTASNGAHVMIIETTYGGGWGAVSHEVINLDTDGIYIEGDSEGNTYVNNGIGVVNGECKDWINGDTTHITSTNTGHFTTRDLYGDWGPFRSNVDILRGNIGNDILDGKTGNDSLYGDSGLDILRGGTGDDVLDGGADTDFLFGQDGADNLLGGLDHDYIDGGVGDDVLYGEGEHDYLVGGAGRDTLYGGDGNDTLLSGIGSDIMNGGSGDDAYIYQRGDGSDVLLEMTTGDTNDILYLIGIHDLYVVKYVDDLMLLFSLDSGDADSLMIENWFSSDGGYQGLEYVVVQDSNLAYKVADLAGIAVDITPQTAAFSCGEIISACSETDFEMLLCMDVMGVQANSYVGNV